MQLDQADPARARTKAMAAVRAGRATLDQYALIDGAEIEDLRCFLVGFGVLLDARRSAGIVDRDGIWELSALTVPPDPPLPQDVARALAKLSATVSIASREPVGAVAQMHKWPIFNGDHVRQCARLLLALGDEQALPARRLIWTLEDGQWTFTPRALAELDRQCLHHDDLEWFFAGRIEIVDEDDPSTDVHNTIHHVLAGEDRAVMFSEVLQVLQIATGN